MNATRRMSSEEPTRETILPCDTPCNRLVQHMVTYARDRALAWGMFGICALVAGYLWVRADKLGEDGAERNALIREVIVKVDNLSTSIHDLRASLPKTP